MSSIKVMVNGLPGNVAQLVARHIIKDNRFELIPSSLTGPEISDSECSVEDKAVEAYERTIEEAKRQHVVNKWTRETLRSLNKLRPDMYPMLKDVKGGTALLHFESRNWSTLYKKILWEEAATRDVEEEKAVLRAVTQGEIK